MKKFALIGKDISYTVSPFVHKRLFSLKNSEASYVVLDGEADDIFAEAKSSGFDVKAMRAILKLRKLNVSDRDEQDLLLETYRKALDM